MSIDALLNLVIIVVVAGLIFWLIWWFIDWDIARLGRRAGPLADDADYEGAHMNRNIIRFFGLGIAVVALSGCALFSQIEGIDRNARYAARIALTAYTDFVQPAVLTYGELADCSPAKPNVKLCKSHARWQEIKGYVHKAHISVAAAGAVIESRGSDEGKITQALNDIEAVQAAFAAAKKEN
jgi:hypothetical protein